MRLSADRTMKGLKGGITMKIPATKSSARPAQDSRNERGHDPVAVTRGLLRLDQFSQDKAAPHPFDPGSAAGVRPLMRRIGGVDTVHTSAVGLGRTSVGSGRIPHVSGGAQCLQGRESGSSPTSGTCFPCSGACGPLSGDKRFKCGPLVGPFLLAWCCGRGLLPLVRRSWLATSSWRSRAYAT